MIIDFHTHIFSPQIRNNREKYVALDPLFSELYSSPKAKLAGVEDLISNMDDNGIDISVVQNIGWSHHGTCMETNDYILESVARYPQRLIGFCMVQFDAVEPAIKELERCAKGGIKGVGEIRPDKKILQNLDLLQPVVQAVIKNKLILLTHASEPVGHLYSGKGEITPDLLYPFITNFPKLNLVCAHWGGGLPFYSLMPEVKKALESVYFDTAASPFLYKPQIYKQVAEIAGVEKILFGSDYPLMSPSRLLKDINAIELPEDSKAQILSGNAQKLLGLKG